MPSSKNTKARSIAEKRLAFRQNNQLQQAQIYTGQNKKLGTILIAEYSETSLALSFQNSTYQDIKLDLTTAGLEYIDVTDDPFTLTINKTGQYFIDTYVQYTPTDHLQGITFVMLKNGSDISIAYVSEITSTYEEDRIGGWFNFEAGNEIQLSIRADNNYSIPKSLTCQTILFQLWGFNV